MNKCYDFEPISGVRAIDNGRTIILTGTANILTNIKKTLTIENKSVRWKLDRLKKQISRIKDSHIVNPEKVKELHAEYRQLEQDVFVHYYEEQSSTAIEVPRGFWWFAENKEIADTNLKFYPFPKGEIDIQPRPYQNEAVAALIKHDRAMVELATGLGKTVVLTHLIEALRKNNHPEFRVMITVPTVELMRQTLSFVQKFFPEAEGIGGGESFKNGCTILVGVINSCIDYADRFDAVIMDEVHHSASMMYNKLIVAASRAKFVYGMTATPTRADGMIMGVHANSGPVVYRRNTRWGVENGFLSRSKFVNVYFGHKKRKNDFTGNDSKAYRDLITSPAVINEAARYVRAMLQGNRRILFLTKHAKPSREFAKKLSEILGIKIESADGGYRGPLNDFREGKTQILIANDDLCGEGVDIPGVDCMFNLTQRSSESKIRQILGRGLRKADGKDFLIFFDFILTGFGKTQRSSSGTHFVDRYLGAARKRKAIYNEIGHCEEFYVEAI